MTPIERAEEIADKLDVKSFLGSITYRRDFIEALAVVNGEHVSVGDFDFDKVIHELNYRINLFTTRGRQFGMSHPRRKQVVTEYESAIAILRQQQATIPPEQFTNEKE